MKKKKKRRSGGRGDNDANDDADSFIEDDEEPRAIPAGPIFQMTWYRIILDEAATIRNKSTKKSRAVTEVEGDLRWILTGTLIYNALTWVSLLEADRSDVFPYLRFLGTCPSPTLSPTRRSICAARRAVGRRSWRELHHRLPGPRAVSRRAAWISPSSMR